MPLGHQNKKMSASIGKVGWSSRSLHFIGRNAKEIHAELVVVYGDGHRILPPVPATNAYCMHLFQIHGTYNTNFMNVPRIHPLFPIMGEKNDGY